MIHNQNLKVVGGTPATVGATATATLVIDRRGYDYASVLVSKAAVSAATAFASVLKVEESDTDGNYESVPALVLGGTGGFTVAAVSTTAASVVKVDVNCLARKRYLRVSMTPDATAVVSMVAVLGRGEEYPYNAATANVATLVTG
jgi:hypothetical protein